MILQPRKGEQTADGRLRKTENIGIEDAVEVEKDEPSRPWQEEAARKQRC